jgi:hypothetical protein
VPAFQRHRRHAGLVQNRQHRPALRHQFTDPKGVGGVRLLEQQSRLGGSCRKNG